MGLLATILVGLIAGLLASWIMKTKTGVFIFIFLGIVGSILGGYISGRLVGADLVTGFSLTSILVSLGGAILVIAIYRFINLIVALREKKKSRL